MITQIVSSNIREVRSDFESWLTHVLSEIFNEGIFKEPQFTTPIQHPPFTFDKATPVEQVYTILLQKFERALNDIDQSPVSGLKRKEDLFLLRAIDSLVKDRSENCPLEILELGAGRSNAVGCPQDIGSSFFSRVLSLIYGKRVRITLSDKSEDALRPEIEEYFGLHVKNNVNRVALKESFNNTKFDFVFCRHAPPLFSMSQNSSVKELKRIGEIRGEIVSSVKQVLAFGGIGLLVFDETVMDIPRGLLDPIEGVEYGVRGPYVLKIDHN